MILGFTGTRKGMTEKQKATFALLLQRAEASLFIHGDCLGADADAHAIAFPVVPVKIRPCTLSNQRAYCKGAVKIELARPPLERNIAIVNESAVLLACPSGFEEELRSGTWATLRYAKRSGKPVVIIWPDGTFNAF